MKIQIYGSGCAKCKQLAENVQTAADAVGADIELEKVTDIQAIVAAGVLTTPALAVDGTVVSSGKVLSPAEIAKLLPPAESACSCGCGCKPKEGVGTEPEKSSCCCGGEEKGHEKHPAAAAADPETRRRTR